MTDPSETNQEPVKINSIANQKIVVSMDNVVNRIILILSILAGVGLIATPILFKRKMGSFIIVMAMLMAMIVAKLLMKSGRVRLSGIHVISSVWIIFTVLILLGGGLENVNVVFYVSLTVVAGLLFGERATVVVATAGIAMGLALALMAILGYLPSRYFLSSPIGNWAELVLALILTASTLNIALRERNNALDVANKQFSNRLEAQKALLESEIRNRSFLEAIPDLMFIFNREGICLDYHAADKNPLAVQPEQFLGKSIRANLPSALVEQLFYSFEKAHETRQTQVVEHVLDIASGRKYFEVRVTPMDDRRQLTIVRDITERQRAEEALRDAEKRFLQVTENIGEWIWEVDVEGLYQYCSPAVERILGYTPEEMVGKKYFFDLFVPEARDSMKQEALAAFRSQQSFRNFVNPNLNKNGEVVILETSGTPIIDEEGNLLGYRGADKDITQRKHVEDTLRESEANYRQLFENAPVAIYRIDFRSGKILKANDVFCEYAGCNREDVSSFSPYDSLTDPSKKLFLERLEKITRGEKVPETVEYELVDKTGTQRCVHLHNKNIYDAEGYVVASDVVAHDITERRRAEEKLRASEELYTTLVDAIPDVVIRFAPDGRILFVNDHTLQISGYRREELEDRNMLMFVAPEDHAKAVENTLLMMENRLGPKEYHLMMKDGRKIPFEVNGDVLKNEDGMPFSVVVVCRDITEHKRAENALRESEAKFRSLVENALGCILIIDLQGTILFANNAVVQTFEADNAESLVGRNVMEFIAEESREDVVKDFGELRQGHDGYLAQYHLMSARGEIIYVESVGKLIIYEGKSAVLTSLLDITERRRAEEEQEKLKDQLIQAQKMESVGRLAGGVAHDFNNMLSVIIGNTEMAMNKVNRSDPLRSTLQEILNAGMRSADLTRQLLAFARKQTVSPKVLDLNDTVTGMLKMLQRLIGEDIDLVWHPGHALWKVRIDPSQVDQLLANLTVNARDAIEKAGRIVIETSNERMRRSLSARAGRNALPGEYVMLAVSDNGRGMDKETLANIFEPFFTTKKEGQGTGLGLATVYGIVKQNGGFINVYSEPEQGSTFKIYLPRHHGREYGNCG